MRHCQKQKVTESRILQKKSLPTCILRLTSLSGHGRFTALSQVSGKSHHIILLCEICDIRFLQSIDSSNRMQSIATRSQQLSSLILSGKYRVSSSVLFALSTGSLIRLEDGIKLLSPTSRWRHFAHHSSSAGSNLTIVAPECILFEKVARRKCGDRKTERADDFASWKNKQNAWQQIASRAEKMGLLQLHRFVKDTELFATPSFFHEIFPHCI